MIKVSYPDYKQFKQFKLLKKERGKCDCVITNESIVDSVHTINYTSRCGTGEYRLNILHPHYQEKLLKIYSLLVY